MKTIILSDYTGEQLAKREEERTRDYHKELRDHTAACENWEEISQKEKRKFRQRVSSRREALGRAWSGRKPAHLAGSLLGLAFDHVFRRPNIPERPGAEPVKKMPGREDSIWQSGQDGEQAVEELLGRSLGGDWTCLAGYHAAAGEIDRTLVGPGGVFAFEIKNASAKVSCDGDVWTTDKYDRYGNRVESGRPMRDNAGRSPARQLNEAADVLERVIHRETPGAKVQRIIVLPHERAEIGSITGLTVGEVVVLKDWNLNRTLQGGTPLDPENVACIIAGIQSSHQSFNHGHRPRRRRR